MMAAEREYFANCGGELKGPLSLDQLKMEVQADRINSQDWVAAKGDPDWKPVGEVIAPAEVPPTLSAVPETKSVEPGGFHQLLAVAAMLLLLVHGGWISGNGKW